MSKITIIQIDNQLVVDSRIIAEQLGIKHKTFLENIRTHKATIEANFGILPFETAEINGRGQPEIFVYLSEDQATFVMTLSRNTPKVVECKVGLVKAFSEQKRQLENPVDRTIFNELADRIANLEAKSIAALPPAVPELTRSMQVRELVTNYVRRMGCEHRAAWTLLYDKFGMLHHWQPSPKSKQTKIAQIEVAGKIEELYQLALKLFI